MAKTKYMKNNPVAQSTASKH